MFRNYVTVALRNLVKHRLYSAINIVGLAVGLAACVLILVFVRNELSYDRFFTGHERLYQVAITANTPGRQPEKTSMTMLPFARAMKESFPEVEETTRIVRQRSVLRRDETQFFELVILADASMFRMFDFPFVAGDRETYLDQPTGIVLSERMARKYFGERSALGQTITIDNQYELVVTGVFKDLPSNTQFDFDIVMPINSVAARNLRALEENWGAICCKTYVRLAEGADIEDVRERLLPWMKRTAPTLNGPNGSVNLGDAFIPSLRPVADVHMEPLLGDMRPGTSKAEIYTFSAVALLVVAIASINFMNLATARATQRAREVSVRKVVGASRTQIVAQFIGESVLLTLIGLLLSLALVELALPAYSAFLQKDLAFDYSDPALLAILLGLAFFVGIAGGAYPAFFLSGFNPAKVLKGASSGVGGGSGRLRMILVVVQFSISIGLMVATAVVYGQLLFAQNKNLGFQRDNLVVLSGTGRPGVRDNLNGLLETLRQDPRIVGAAATNIIPGEMDESNTNIRLPGGDPTEQIVIRNDTVGPEFVSTMGMRIIAGRDFDKSRGTDVIQRPDWQLRGEPTPEGTQPFSQPGAALINESAVRRLGYASPEAAIGQTFTAGDSEVSSLDLTIIGVVEDFHFRSIHDPIAPGFFITDNGYSSDAVIRVRGDDVRGALEAIDTAWRNANPSVPVQRAFLDDQLQALYEREQQTGTLFAAFSGLAIVIACLGLFGLASFTAERRTKEIGLRKVLGASVTDIVRLLVWQFSKPVLVANLIAWPLAWYGMSRWLESFTYRIDLNPLPFLLAGAAALAIAWATVGLHAAKVARSKPVTALRYE